MPATSLRHTRNYDLPVFLALFQPGDSQDPSRQTHCRIMEIQL
jgi:hypothetical protein